MTKLKQADIEWIENRLSYATSGADLITPRPEFIQRAKAELMDLPIPQDNRMRQLTVWTALILAVSAILVTIWYLGQRRSTSKSTNRNE